MKVLITFLLSIGILSGCSINQKASYYHLSAPPITSIPTTNKDIRVMVGPVSLPAMIDQPELVVQDGANTVQLYPYQRWAGSLKNDVERVVSSNLTQELSTPHVWSYSQSLQTQFNYQVFLDVQSLESKLGREIVLDVIWTIKPTNRKDEASSKKNVVKAATINGRSRVTEKVSNEGFEALVEAQSKAFYKVSLDIAKAIQ
jgi:uncharacterized lipoprotein YmbA